MPRVVLPPYGTMGKLGAALLLAAKTTPDLDTFKAALASFKGITCKCAMCKYQFFSIQHRLLTLETHPEHIEQLSPLYT